MGIVLLCVASNQGTFHNIQDLGLFSSLNIPHLARWGNEGSSQIIESILHVIGSYHISRMRISNGKPFQLIED